MHPSLRTSGLLAFVLVASLCAWAANLPEKTAPESPAPESDDSFITLDFKQGRLTLKARNAPLADVLHAIGDEAGIVVKISGSATGRLNLSIIDVELEDGLRRLLRGYSYAISYAPGEAGRARLREVSVVAPAGASPSVAAAKATPPDRATLQKIRALARRRDAQAIAELGSLAASDPNPGVRSQAVAALAGLRNEQALAPLTLAMGDQDSSVRIQAIRGISSLKGTAAIGDLGGVLANDPDPSVRRQALRILAGYQNPEVASLLQSAAADQDAGISQEAKQALTNWQKRYSASPGAARGTR